MIRGTIPRMHEPLHIDWCNIQAARHATERWHYTGTVPQPVVVSHGVWEHQQFVGVITYGTGANPNIARPFNCTHDEVLELTRIALHPDHEAPVSQCIAYSRSMLHEAHPNVRVLVSYADPLQGHHGGVYQADNWVYTGTSHKQPHVRIGNRVYHKRTVASKFGTADTGVLNERLPVPVSTASQPPKHRYAYPLDATLRPRIERLAHPYPDPDHSHSNAQSHSNNHA